MGTPDFAVPAFRALHAAGHAIVAVYCQPPRPAGRGYDERRCAVHEAAVALGLPVHTPVALRDAAVQATFIGLEADIAVVAAYGLILPKPVLAAPRLGCLNIHASLLPRWRGAAPIHRAIMAGDRETGVCIMQMEAGLDTGPVLRTARVAIGPRTTTGELHDALAGLGASLVVDVVADLSRGVVTATPQPTRGVTYAAKIKNEETRIDWRLEAVVLDRLIRGLSPVPGAWFQHAGFRVKVLAAELAEGRGDPGVVLDEQLTIACGSGAIRLLHLQRDGRKAMAADAYLRGQALPAGTRVA